MSYTPGPWTVSSPFIVTENNNVVAITANKCMYTLDYAADVASLQDLANARLIAAAPELLEACEELESWWRLPNASRTIASIEPVIRKALDAIAKVEGGS